MRQEQEVSLHGAGKKQKDSSNKRVKENKEPEEWKQGIGQKERV